MERILLGHGSGGRLMHQLIAECFVPEFDIKELGDSATINSGDLRVEGSSFRLAFTTDSYVVSPLFFPGGTIGELAVNGTVNDLSVVGARPYCLSTGFIIEEGLPMDDFRRILSSMSKAAKKAGVHIIAGDTKVVEKGKGDGIFINTSGIGVIPDGITLGPQQIKAGDKVIVSGAIGNHGIAVLSQRNGLVFQPPVLSDTAPLNGLVEFMFNATEQIKMMRDPTRGGVATTLKELALESHFCITMHESLLPIPGGVIGACELLGLDPLYVANEGILIAIVGSQVADKLVSLMKTHPLGTNAAIIGEVTQNTMRTKDMVLLKTAIGGTRVVDMLSGEQLPRIC